MIALVDPLLILLTVILAGYRVAGVTSSSYQAAAHLVVGLFFGLYFGGRERMYLWLALGLTAVEASMFLWTRVF